MKAAVVVANEDVQYQEVEEPKVTKGTVKIKVRYSGICGSDIPRVLNHGVHFYPIVLGHEFSGDVVEVGEGVTRSKLVTVYQAPLLPCMLNGDFIRRDNLLSLQTLQLYWFQTAGSNMKLS